MPLEELRDVLRRKPFQPFRLFVTDGSTFDIRHPELCVPGARSVFIGTPAPGQIEPIYDRFAIVDLVHITRLEPIAASTSGNGQSSP